MLNETHKNIFDKVVKTQYEKASGDREREWIDLKDKHSRQVLDTGIEILNKEKELESFDDRLIEYSESALLLHDLGRFFQFKNGTVDKSIKHGELGADVLKNEYNLFIPQIILPVKVHDKIEEVNEFYVLDEEYKSLDKETQNEVLLISKLVKDADRMANYRLFKKEMSTGFTEKRLVFEIHEKALEAFYNRELINWKLATDPTVFDFMMLVMCWQNDLYFDSTKEIIKEEGINVFLVGEMRRIANEIFTSGAREELEEQYKNFCTQISEIERALIDFNML